MPVTSTAFHVSPRGANQHENVIGFAVGCLPLRRARSLFIDGCKTTRTAPSSSVTKNAAESHAAASPVLRSAGARRHPASGRLSDKEEGDGQHPDGPPDLQAVNAF
jgi:hypothetical protein